MNNSSIPVVSVCMITYNHENFISQAIEGVLMQKCDFPFELVIGEDCSTDKTREICETYRQKHPELIRLLPIEKNLGMIPNFIRTLQACTGKYIALCEGDDYWIDTLKLQKQTDIFKSNFTISGIHTKVVYINRIGENTGVSNRVNSTRIMDSFENLIQKNTIQTCSFIFRSSVIKENPEYLDLLKGAPVGDQLIFLLTALHGTIFYLDEPTCVYRQGTGIMSSQDFAGYRNILKRTQSYDRLKNLSLTIPQRHARQLGYKTIYYQMIREALFCLDFGRFVKYVNYAIWYTFKTFTYKDVEKINKNDNLLSIALLMIKFPYRKISKIRSYIKSL